MTADINNELDAEVIALDLEREERSTFSVEWMNSRYALVVLGRNVVIYRDLHGADDGHRFLTLAAFKDYYCNKFVWLPGPSGRMRRVTWAKAWLEHKERRTFEGIEFFPCGKNEKGRPGFMNLWKGFSVAPAPVPDSKRYGIFLDHLRNNVCDGDEAIFKWVWAFFADMVQRPRDKPGVALVLRGGRGVGKTIVGEIFCIFHSRRAVGPQASW
jgi:hypothetical protein